MNWLLALALHNVVVVMFLALLVWGITRFWNNPPAAHLLWLLVLVKLVTPPVVNLDLRKWSALPDAGIPHAAATATVGPPQLPDSQPPEIGAPWNLAAGEGPSLAAADQPAAVPPPPPRITLAAASNLILPALAWIWLGGAALVALVAGMRIVRFQRMLAGTLPASQQTRTIADGLAKQMGLAQSPDIRVVDSAVAPLVWCAGGRATVVLPLRLLGALDEQQTAMVLAHELAHLRRRDHWVRGLELVVSVLYWWNPLVWWVRRRLHAVEEQCCDAWVAWAYPDRSREYAECLLKWAELLPGLAPQPALASPFLNAHSLKERIELVLENRSPRTASRIAAVGLALLAAVVIPAGVRGAAEAREEESPKAAAQKTAPPKAALPKSRDEAVKATKDEPPLTAADEVDALQGTWKFDIYYSDWWPERISDPPIRWSKWRWQVEGNEIHWTGMKVPDVKLSFTVDPSKSPRQIDLTFLDGPHKGKKLQGMYEFFAAGACHICFADPDAKVPRPKEVAYSTNAGQTMVSIERVPPEVPAKVEPAKDKTADRGPEVDAAIVRLREQGAKVREFHPRGDAQYWVQIISHNFDDDDLADVEIIARGIPLHFHLSDSRVTPAGLERLASAGRINQLELSGDSIDDALLKSLPKLPLHGQLGLYSDQLTNAGVQPVAECRELTAISLEGNLSDDSLKRLAGLSKLQRVSLGKHFTRRAFDILGKMENLTNLDASDLNPDLSDLQKIPKLQTLSLTGKKYDDEAALAIADTFKALESAYLRGTSITSAGVAHLSRLEKLKILTLDDSLVDDGIADSIRKMKQLTWLSVGNCAVGDDTLAALSECPEMWYVFLVDTQVTDAGLAHLPKLKKPLALYLAGCEAITDAGITSLAQLPDSASLNIELTSSGVTAEGFAELKAALPLAQIRRAPPVPRR